jgi:hypothetical protein
VVIELTKDKSDYAACAASRASKNHLALRVPDIDAAVAYLKSHGVEFEAEPMEIVLPFDQPLPTGYLDTFEATDGKAARMKVASSEGQLENVSRSYRITCCDNWLRIMSTDCRLS